VIAAALDAEIGSHSPRDFEAELAAVHRAATDWAIDHEGFVPTLTRVRAIDQTAVGHIDWFDKLTLRVADFVVWGDG